MALTVGTRLEIVAKLNFNGIAAIRNVYHARVAVEVPGTDQDAVDDIALFMGVMYNEIADLLPNNVAAEGVDVKNLTTGLAMGTAPFGDGFTGGTTSNVPTPLGCAAVIRLVTNVVGSQGRKFLGPLSYAAITDDAILITSAMVKLAAFGLWLLQEIEMGVGSANFVVYDRIHHTVGGIVQIIVNGIPGYQRRRKQNVGI